MKSTIMKTRIVKAYWGMIGLILLLMGAGRSVGYAQVRPITANMVINPPYTLALDDYASPTSNKLSLLLLLRDANISGRRVRLKFTITSPNNVRLTTSDAFFLSQPGLVLNIGAPLMLSGGDPRLRQFFDLANLTVNMGANDLNQFRQSKRLPSGVYTWQVEVFDYNRPNARLSNANLSRQTIWMVLNQPPIVNLPLQNQKLRATNYGTQNVIFQWLNRSASSPNSAFSTQYNVFLYELFEPNGPVSNPVTAPRTLVYRNTLPLTTTTLIYNNTFPALTPGKRYIFQVQAEDREKRDLFENQGFSEVVVFQYGDECLPPANLVGKAVDFQTIRLDWDASPNQTQFVVRYRPAGSSDSWTETTSQFNDVTLKYLKDNTEYEYEVSSICGALNNNNWVSGKAKTKQQNQQEGEDNFVCGVPKGTYDLSNQTPLDVLNEGDVILAGGYKVTIRRATGGTGQFSGVGITKVPVGRLKVKFKVGFKDIFVNADKKMMRGSIYVVRNKWKAMEFAEHVTVDTWRIQNDGRVQIKRNGGGWEYVSSGKDYMLVDATTQKKLFVDRNGKSDIPLEDRDYSNLTPKEILAEIKKLKEEADEAIADGRWGDALKLADKATELAGKIVDSADEVKEALKKLYNDMKDLVKETLQEIKDKAKGVKDSLTASIDLAAYNKLRNEVIEEDKKYNISGGKSEPKTGVMISSVVVKFNKKNRPQKTHAEISKTAKAIKLAQEWQKFKPTFEKVKLEKVRIDQILLYIQNPSKFEDLLTKTKGSLDVLKDKLIDALLQNNTDQVKQIIKTEVQKILDEVVKEFIEKE